MDTMGKGGKHIMDLNWLVTHGEMNTQTHTRLYIAYTYMETNGTNHGITLTEFFLVKGSSSSVFYIKINVNNDSRDMIIPSYVSSTKYENEWSVKIVIKWSSVNMIL